MNKEAGNAEKCKENESYAELVAIVRRLRGEGGCPWDRAQTHTSLSRYLIEETYEVIDAIERSDTADLREELGDLLLQVLFHAEIEREAGRFDIGDVAAEECEKMIRRHPHVFGTAGAEETLASWETSKNLEKKRNTLAERLGSVPRALPALLRAQKLLEKAKGDLPDSLLPSKSAVSRILDLSGVAKAEDKTAVAGEFLFAAVASFASAGVDCEAALSYVLQGFFERISAFSAQLPQSIM